MTILLHRWHYHHSISSQPWRLSSQHLRLTWMMNYLGQFTHVSTSIRFTLVTFVIFGSSTHQQIRIHSCPITKTTSFFILFRVTYSHCITVSVETSTWMWLVLVVVDHGGLPHCNRKRIAFFVGLPTAVGALITIVSSLNFHAYHSNGCQLDDRARNLSSDDGSHTHTAVAWQLQDVEPISFLTPTKIDHSTINTNRIKVQLCASIVYT